MRRVCITGVGGFLGQYAAQHFHQAGWWACGLDAKAPENAPNQWLQNYHRARLPNGGASDWLVEMRPDLVVHSAGRASVGYSFHDPVRDFCDNTMVTLRLLEALRQRLPDCRFVLLSSAAVYGNPDKLPVNEDADIKPISPYGFHKYQAELLCKEYASVHGLPTCVVRIFSAYGPGLRRQVVWDIAAKILAGDGQINLFGTGHESRDFVHARDIASAVATVAEKAPMEGEIYNLASGVETTIANLAVMLINAFERDIEIEWDGECPRGNPTRWQADLTRICKLGFVPLHDLGESLKEFVTWSRPLLQP